MLSKKRIQEIINEVNHLGKKYSGWSTYSYYSISKTKVKGMYNIHIINHKTKIIKTTRLSYLRTHNPFGKIRFKPPGYVKSIINKLGNKPKNKYKKYIYVKSFRLKGKLLVTVKNKYSNELLTRQFSNLNQGRNPFTKRNIQSWIPEVKYYVNKLGKKWSFYEKFKFHSIIKKSNKHDLIIKIQNIASKKIVQTRYSGLKDGRNPFRREQYTPLPIIKKTVNILGKKGKDKNQWFKFVEVLPRTDHFIKVKISNYKTKENRIINFDSLKSGTNPFRCVFDNHEKEVLHPKIIKILKINNIDIVSYEKNISPRSRPDFVIKSQLGYYYILEIKSDKKKWSKNEILEQKIKYIEDGNKKYKKKFKKVVFISNSGKYGISIKEFKHQVNFL